MALRSDSESNDDVNQGAGMPAVRVPPKESESISTPPRSRGGGPKTVQGKRRSSRSSTKHGIHAKSPVIGDEREKDWVAHWEGYRTSFEPVGHHEESLVRAIALNRLQYGREECWMTETLQLQFEGIEHQNRQSVEPDEMGLPEDEVAWWDHDPWAAMAASVLLQAGDLDAVVPFESLVAYLVAFRRFTGVEHPGGGSPGPLMRSTMTPMPLLSGRSSKVSKWSPKC